MTEGAPSKIASGYLAGTMWWYAANVLYPAQALKRAGVALTSGVIGEEPEQYNRAGLGVYFSKRHSAPVLLTYQTEHDHLVEEFDRMAEVYAEYVEPFSRPIFDEALKIMSRLIRPDARVLDTGCGPGRELIRVARLVPNGEVIGSDLAAEMLNTAHRAARAAGLDNCAFFQADAGALPPVFNEKFDVVYNCLAHHHYPDPMSAATCALRVLRPGGVYCIVDPGPAWYNALSAPLAKWGDPGWIGFHTPEQFRRLLQDAGFARTSWSDLLPGFGLAIGQTAPRSKATKSKAMIDRDV